MDRPEEKGDFNLSSGQAVKACYQHGRWLRSGGLRSPRLCWLCTKCGVSTVVFPSCPAGEDSAGETKPGEDAGLLPTLAKVRCSRPFTTVWTPMGLTLPKPATSPLTAIISCSYSVATTSSSCET